MAVISSATIRKRLITPDDNFNITPIFDWDKQISTSSVDLRLDNQFIVITRTSFSSINPIQRKNVAALIPQYQKKITIPYGQKFVLHPNELVLGSTIEYLSFPNDLMAYVIGRSSWGRLGLIIATATAINPCFKGTLTLELVNAGNVPIELYPGVRIAQLILHTIDGEESSGSKYQLQIGPGFSRIHEDSELDYLSIPKYKVIIGLTGHKGSGKSIFSNYLMEDRSYKYFSLSHIVRREYNKRVLKVPGRDNLQDYGDKLRSDSGADYLARQIIKDIQEEYPDSNSCILIDGIRNPAEVALLSTLPNFYLVGIDTSEERIKKNLKTRGYLVSGDEQGALKREMVGETNLTKKKLLLTKLKECVNQSQFIEAYNRDCGLAGLEADKKGLGQNINACLDMCNQVNKIEINNETKPIDVLLKFKEIIQGLE